jgi:hypothetical protein
MCLCSDMPSILYHLKLLKFCVLLDHIEYTVVISRLNESNRAWYLREISIQSAVR